jgi:microcystin-dependent protein
MSQAPVPTLQPALTLTEFLDTTGVFPSKGGGSGSGPFLGSIGIFAGPSFVFNDPANGQTFSIASDTALFSILGTDFGGNGTSDFELPNLGGVETVGAGQGAGLPFVGLGQTLGQTSYDLTPAQLPSSLGGVSAAIDTQQPSLGLNYVINAFGVFPGGTLTLNSLGVVSAFAGNFAPSGELFCDGQLLQISQFSALFQLIGTTYGGDGVTTFALPDLQGRDIVGAGADFTLGEQVGAANVALTNANSPLGLDAPVSTQQPGLVMNYYIAVQGIFPPEGTPEILVSKLHTSARSSPPPRIFPIPRAGRYATVNCFLSIRTRPYSLCWARSTAETASRVSPCRTWRAAQCSARAAPTDWAPKDRSAARTRSV